MSPSGSLDAATTATGVVRASDGSPVAGAEYDVTPLDGQEFAGADLLRRTDDTGRYQLALAPGAWKLTVTADGFATATARLDVGQSGVAEQDVVLQRG